MQVFNRLMTAFVVAVILGCTSNAQDSQFSFSTITPIEPIKNHYKILQTHNSGSNPSRAWMDTVVYPPELYRNNTLLFALTRPIYLSATQVEFLKNSLKFPANSSDQVRAELDFLLELQQNRTVSQQERVLEIARIGYWPDANHVPTHPFHKQNLANLFFECGEIVGKGCTAGNYPYTSKLLQNIMNDMRLMEFRVKYHLLRARPYQLEPRLDPMQRIKSPSFASGHTLWAYIQAYTFSELIPKKREDFLTLAYEIGFSREVLGVHYPSDEEAARQLAHRMLELMWNTEKFQADFKKARVEWD